MGSAYIAIISSIIGVIIATTIILVMIVKEQNNCIDKFLSFNPWQKKEREKKERKKRSG